MGSWIHPHFMCEKSSWTGGLGGEGSVPAFGELKSLLVGWARWRVGRCEGWKESAWPRLWCHPLLPVPQASEHNVSHEAVAIKRMLELGLVRNLTYF